MEKQSPAAPQEWTIRRRYPRRPLSAHVRKIVDGQNTSGLTGDIGEGGVLILSDHTLEPRSEVRVSFELPSGRRIDVPGEVVHSLPSVRMGVRFIELSEEDRKAIAEYVEEIKPYKRRSARLARRLLVDLRWQDWEGNWHEEAAETVLISKHGGMILTPARMKPGENALVRWPETGRQAEARIIFRRLNASGELSELGFEFLDAENFWSIEFPPDIPLWEMKNH